MQVLKQQYPSDEGFEIVPSREFKFEDVEDGSDPFIQMNVSDNEHCTKALKPQNGKVIDKQFIVIAKSYMLTISIIPDSHVRY